VQETAKLLGRKLHVYNLSQSADVSDLLGGFRPLNANTYIAELSAEFISLIRLHFDYKKNISLVSYLNQLLNNNKHMLALSYIARETKSILSVCKQQMASQDSTTSQQQISNSDSGNFSRKAKAFKKFEAIVDSIIRAKDVLESSLIFKFIQGNLVNALRHGDWVLLDEINLAQPEVLQNILPILEGKSIILLEKGEIREVRRNPEFKLFGCMNPGNTVGKKELPPLIRKNFTEYFVKELEDPNEITQIVKNKSRMQFQEAEYAKITEVYLQMKKQVNEHLITDGFNRKPTISLRALSRAIEIAMCSQGFYPSQRGRYVLEGLYAALSSNLSIESKVLFDNLIKGIFQIDANYLEKTENSSKNLERAGFINVDGFLLKLGSQKPKPASEADFLMTGSVKRNMVELLRVVCHSHYPILLEGPTSAGKTSMIKYLGEISGNKVVRINNHQHTDLDEYIGSYSPDESGKLVFKEGLMVEAMRKGYWIILDELNLARSEILEALNRLLDDNRELYIPEINEVVKPHQDFRIFATQNPLDYGGRKELSVAFRSRFFHFFIRDIDDADLVKIIETRCKVPESRSKKLVEIMKSLRVLRSRQNMFSGKESMITIRDLIKWGSREIVDIVQLATNGYCLLAERLRFEEEREQVKKIIMDKCLKGEDLANFNPERSYREYFDAAVLRLSIASNTLNSVYWSQSFIRMFTLTHMALDQSEPVLLIGETGSGKTTVAELIAKINNVELYTVNCHQYSESSDFIGGLRPVRGKDELLAKLRNNLQEVQTKITGLELPAEEKLSFLREIEVLFGKLDTSERVICFNLCLNQLTICESKLKESNSQHLNELVELKEIFKSISKDAERLVRMFEWVDGPLVQAMVNGGVLLIDEISLAQDSVLERLNSVLEKEKSLVLSEKGDGSVQELVAHPKFYVIATMNPSGDFGKKELTPALRNRFTEVWVKPVTDPQVLSLNNDKIENINSFERLSELPKIENDFLHFVQQELERLNSSAKNKQEWISLLSICLHTLTLTFNNLYSTLLKPLTVRDIKSSLPFFFKTPQNNTLSPPSQVPLDVSNFLTSMNDYLELIIGGFKCLDLPVTSAALEDIKMHIESTVKRVTGNDDVGKDEGEMDAEEIVMESDREVRIGRYGVEKVKVGHVYEDRLYSVNEKIVRENLKKIMMSLTLNKAIMLEGPPGVGKTSLTQFLANKIGMKFYRVNLNEQTDMIDLLGSDVPTSSSSVFSWADGVLIQAMKEGSWILLDELNMATQTVLEGLNSVLDHRGSIYLPELDKTIVKHPSFRLFAAQNPVSMGSGRKGLPHSFLTRFTRVWIEELSRDSMQDIINRVYPVEIQNDKFNKMVRLFFDIRDLLRNHFGANDKKYNKTAHHYSGAGQWEFNLRDLHKMIEIVLKHRELGHSEDAAIEAAVRVIVMDRLDDDKISSEVRSMYHNLFGTPFFGYLHRLTDGKLELPKYLNMHNTNSLHNLLMEPLITSLEVVITTRHPILLLTDSRNECSVFDTQALLQKLSERTYKKKVQSLSLFSSSDLTDLIGSYEQSNPVGYTQDASAKRLCNDPSSDLVLGAFSTQAGNPPLFSWEESEIMKALRKGDWVVIKGAEQVNPAILERLNGVLEEDEIFLNEALGGEEHQVRVKKSPEARIFVQFDIGRATLPPSRALRNRCVEIRLSNYEAALRYPTNLDEIAKGIVKTAVEQADTTVGDIIACEKFTVGERVARTYEIFYCNFKHFIGSMPASPDWNWSQPESITDLIKQVSALIQKNVVYRRNYYFSSQLSSEEQLTVQERASANKYSVSPLLSSDPLPLIHNLIIQFLYSRNMVNSSSDSLIGADNGILSARWSGLAKELLTTSTREDLEEELSRISTLGRDKVLLSLLAITSTRKMGKIADSALKEVMIHCLNKRRIGGLSQTMRSVIQEGFVSPVQLSLVILYNFLLAKSSGFSGCIDRSGENKPTESNADLWNSICQVLSKKSILKFKIVAKTDKDDYLAKQLFPFIKQSLGQKAVVDEENLKSLLDLVSNTIQTNFNGILDKLQKSFISYDFLDESTNLLTRKLVYHAGAENTESFLAILSKHSLLELIGPSDEVQTIADYIQENFATTKNLLNWSEKIKKYASRDGKMRVEFLQELCRFFCPESANEVFLNLCIGEAELSKRNVKRLGEKLGKLDFSQLRVSDINLVEKMSEMVREVESSAEINWDWVNMEKIAESSELTTEDRLKVMEDICKYADNPNQTTMVSLLDQISKIIKEEDDMLTTSYHSYQNRVFWSVLQHLQSIKRIHDSLREVGNVLRSQKTRQVSKYQFEGETQSTQSGDQSLSGFLTKAIFRLLSKNCSFLADTDVQEMKRLTEFCKNKLLKQQEVDQAEYYGCLDDTFNLYKSFYKSGSMVTFGDFLLPFFSNLFHSMISLKQIFKISLSSPTHIAGPYYLPQLESLAQRPSTLSPLGLSLLLSLSASLGLHRPSHILAGQLEGQLMIERQRLDKEEALSKGRSFDEASRLRNLQKGIERHVRDEYTKEAVETNREETKWELFQIFGSGELAEQLDLGKIKEKVKEWENRMRLKELRVKYMNLIVDGLILRARDESTLTSVELKRKVAFASIYFAHDNEFDFSDVSRKQVLKEYSFVFRAQIQEAISTQGIRDVKKTLMLENTSSEYSLSEFQAFWHRQLEQLIDLDQNSFYKGNCSSDLVQLRPVLYNLLGKVQELRKNEDLRELPSFNNLISVSDFILNLNLKKANLGEVCLLLERLSTYILDYESMTPRAMHFPDIKEKISGFLWEFRQKERRSWRGLVFAQGLDIILSDLEDCLQFRNVLTNELMKKESENSRAILDLVDQFLMKTNLIREPSRLYFLSRVLSSLPQSSLHSLVTHIMLYHLSFIPSLFTLYQANFPQVNEPIKENELLANWHMKDLTNMKMNAHKFHKGVHRAMKSHKEILEMGAEGFAYKRKRDSYLGNSVEEVLSGLSDDGTSKRLAEAVRKAEERKKKAAKKKDKDGKEIEIEGEGDGEDKQEEVADARKELEKEKEKIPVIGKTLIDKILAKPEYKSEEIKPLVQANIRLFRINNTVDWLDLFGETKKQYRYKNYESALDQCDSFISDWMATLEDMKSVNSKSNRLRVLDSFLKLLYQMGVRERQPIDNWDPVKTFALNPYPLAEEHLSPHLKKSSLKKQNRLYEMVDMLYVHKANVVYGVDVQPMIRSRMQAYMVYLTNWCMAVSRLSARALSTIRAVKNRLGMMNNGGLVLLKDKDRERFEKELARREKVSKNGWGRGSDGQMVSETQKKEDAIFEVMRSFKDGKISLEKLNQVLTENGHIRGFSGVKVEVQDANNKKLRSLISKLQSNLGRDISTYDLQTKTKYFMQTIPMFIGKIPQRLLPLTTASPGTAALSAELSQLSNLLSVLETHIVKAEGSLCKFSWIALRVFHSIIYKGLCVKNEDKEDDNQEEGSEEYDFGTGVGEGKGDENATDKYDYEEQLLGEKDQGEDVDEQDNEDRPDDAEDGNEKGGDAMSMENDFEGDNEEKKDGEEKEEEKGDEDNEMSEVNEDQIDQDLWDDKNEDMQDSEEKQEDEEKERREAEEHEYKGEQRKEEDQSEQRAKEPNEKEQRQAEDFEAQDDKQPDEDEKKNAEEEEEKKDEEKDEYAEVESRSAMSDRNENEDMEFDDEKPEEKEGMEEEQHDNLDVDENAQIEDEEENNKEEELEEFDDPLNKEERKMEDEQKSEAEPQNENEEQIKESGLNPETAKEKQQDQTNQDNTKETERQTKDQSQKIDKSKTKNKEEKKKELKEQKQTEESNEKENKDEKDKENEKNENTGENEIKEQEMDMKPPKENPSNDISLIDKSRLAELLANLLAGDDQSEEGGDIEGLAEGQEGTDVKVKQNKQTGKQPMKKIMNKDSTPAIEVTRHIDDDRMDREDMDEENRDDGQDNGKDDQEDRHGDKEQEMVPEVEGEAPTKLIKQDKVEEDLNEMERPSTIEEVQNYLKLLNEDYTHMSESNHSWAAIEPQLRTRAYNLCEELRNILKPTKIAGLKGDFRTGKRLNMRKVIGYVASNYRKDKIWLRRSDPTQREYEIALAIDDTLSMSEKNVGYLALESLITLALALTKLEVGKINISGIRNGIHEVLPFSKPFQSSDGQRIISQFTFKYADSMSADLGLPQFLTQIQERFTPSTSFTKILFIISDGFCNKNLVRPCALSLEDSGVLVIYIILDKKDEKGSVLNVRSTSFEEVNGQRRVRLQGYMEDFPFRHYIIVQDVHTLTQVLLGVLREYFGRVDN